MGKVIIEVEYEGIRDNAYRAIDAVLGAGSLQEDVEAAAARLGVKLKVTHAMVKAAPVVFGRSR